MNINNVSVEIAVNGNPVRSFLHEGRIFIEAREGSEYTINVKNNNWHRVMVVSSVDGLNVLTGKEASRVDNGYIVDGHGNITIKGYRKSNEEVGAFKFCKKEKSYAKSKGNTSNVGIISVAVFKEKQFDWQKYYYQQLSNINITQDYYKDNIWQEPQITWTCGPKTTAADNNILRSYTSSVAGQTIQNSSANIMYSCSLDSPSSCELQAINQAQIKSFAAGSTWGQKIQDKVIEVVFEKESEIPMAEFSIYYDFKAGLEKLGIKFIKETKVSFPQGFPRKYAQPPSGWDE